MFADIAIVFFVNENVLNTCRGCVGIFLQDLSVMFFRIRAFLLAIYFSFFALQLFASAYSSVSKGFDVFANMHEGEMTFRSLLIPAGGRMAGLNGAFTALANDITFFEANPAGSSSLKNTEIAFFHNAWIADSHLDSLFYSMRSNNFGYGASLRCFYVPFTEYGSYGERLSSGYYSETFLTFNVSYNFFSGYKFKGLSLGSNLKVGLASFPPFEGQLSDGEESTLKMRKANATSQMGFATLADFGMQIKGDFFKNFDARDPNIFFGLALKNIGPPIKGNVAPASFSFGFAYQPIKILTFSFDGSIPINVANASHSGKPFFSAGLMFGITKYFNLLSGFGVKGGNPSFTLAGEVNFASVQLNACYTLDLTTQTTALNHIILGIKIIFGDRGRGAFQDKIESMYMEGLHLYQEKKYEEAIAVWEEVLKLNKHFEPAKRSIKSAKNMKLLQDELLKLDQFEY